MNPQLARFFGGRRASIDATVVAFVAVGLGYLWARILAKYAAFPVYLYHYSTCLSIMLTLSVCVSYQIGAYRQRKATARWDQDKLLSSSNRGDCCGGAVAIFLVLLAFVIGVWGAVFSFLDMGYTWNLIFALFVFWLYCALDVGVFVTTRKQACAQRELGISEDTKHFFWHVDFPTALALSIFAVTCWLEGPTDLALSKPGTLHAFAQGGLAFLVIASNLAFIIGYPKFVVPWGVPWATPWYDPAKVCAPADPQDAEAQPEGNEKEPENGGKAGGGTT